MESLEEILIFIFLGIVVWKLLTSAESVNSHVDEQKALVSDSNEVQSSPDKKTSKSVLLSEYHNGVIKNIKLLELMMKLDDERLCMIEKNFKKKKLPKKTNVKKLIYYNNLMNEQLTHDIKVKILSMKEAEKEAAKAAKAFRKRLKIDFYGADYHNSGGGIYTSSLNERQRGTGGGY